MKDDSISQMKQHYMSRINTINQSLEINKAAHQQRLMSASSRSKSPLSNNMPRQVQNNNLGGIGTKIDSSADALRKITLTSNFRRADSSDSSSSSDSECLKRATATMDASERQRDKLQYY
jgi:hypothetical protein